MSYFLTTLTQWHDAPTRDAAAGNGHSGPVELAIDIIPDATRSDGDVSSSLVVNNRVEAAHGDENTRSRRKADRGAVTTALDL